MFSQDGRVSVELCVLNIIVGYQLSDNHYVFTFYPFGFYNKVLRTRERERVLEDSR
jgi:hypothetical protein